MKPTTKAKRDFLGEMITLYKTSIARLEAHAHDESFILAWDNGLGVIWADDEHNPQATNLVAASKIADASTTHGKAQAAVPEVRNGNGERAVARRRSEAIATYLPRLRASLAELQSMADA